MRKLVLVVTTLFALAPATFAGAIFNFTFADAATKATAIGQLTINSATLATDLTLGGGSISDLEALTIVVSDLNNSLVTYGLADFLFFEWWPAGANFDYSQNLVGQPTDGKPWGTPDGHSGNFVFFMNYGTAPFAPNEVDWFTIRSLGGEKMVLTSLQESPLPAQETPEPGAMGLASLGGIAIFAISRRRVRSSL